MSLGFQRDANVNLGQSEVFSRFTTFCAFQLQADHHVWLVPYLEQEK
jgi:hypothetical protein